MTVEVVKTVPRADASSTLAVREDSMPDATDMLRESLHSAGLAMRWALAEIGPDEMGLEPGDGLRSLESLLGEATMTLRETLVELGYERLPELPEEFENRYGRWGTGAELVETVRDLTPSFATNMDALDRVIRAFGPDDLDVIVDLRGSLDEDGIDAFETVGRRLISTIGSIHVLAGEASITRLALGKPASPDPFDSILAGGAGLLIEPSGVLRRDQSCCRSSE